jgi:23S rRNA (cytidine2498-2'-O)-methyltransferase
VGQEAPLLKELRKSYPASQLSVLSEGFVECLLTPEDAAATPCAAFSLQCLPHAVDLPGESINQLGREAAEAVMAALKTPEDVPAPPWTLHAFCHDYPGSPVRMARAEKVGAALLETLGKKQRRLLKARVDGAPSNAALVQVALRTPTAAVVSICLPADRVPLRRVLSRFPGGDAVIPLDTSPPSRAYAKIREALLHLDTPFKRGEFCVDLGASPGGWTYDALHAGCTVFAIDRSPLRGDLMQHKQLRFVTGDAFEWTPKRPVDWLLCDVIAFPNRTIPLLKQWLREKWCRHFVFTIKFKGDEDYAMLEEAKRMLEHHALDFTIRQLHANKNEVTAFGTARPA